VFENMAGTTRLELATSAVTGQRSNQLNYVPAKDLALLHRFVAQRFPAASLSHHPPHGVIDCAANIGQNFGLVLVQIVIIKDAR
jgi:hypothetical protein